ncbi:MAG: two-component sensor histidine kinase [Actinobacteria bacterium]|nr:two-component sensor histidine kinase [Actinomycetota bacterium]
MSESGPVSEDEARMLAAVPDAAVVLDGRGDVVRANVRALQFHLVLADRLAHPQLSALVERFRERRTSQEEDLVLRRGPSDQAGVLHMHVSVAPLARDRVLILARDQTAARRLDETRRDFVANVSHELKTPVGAISLLAETVAESADEPEAVAHFSEQMKREASRLATLVQEIIDLSRLQEPDALVKAELVQVDDVVEEALDRVRVAAEAHGISLVRGGERGLRVYGDEALLTTAVRNLLDNAIRYSPGAGRVSIGVKAAEGMVRIAVVDQGMGIPAEAQSRVFERFYRLDEARSRDTGGTGLGLSIVKHIAADHGGEVTLWSKEGRGSTFTLVIPQVTDGRSAA